MLGMAVLGVGRMGMVHARNVAASKGADLRAIADPDQETARAISAETGAPVCEIDSIIADPAIEAILIATPTDTHADLVERAAEAGKAIFCEKPIDLDVGRVRACLKVVERTGAQLFVAFNRRFHVPIADMRARLRAGEIGKLEVLSIASYDPVQPSQDYLARSGGMFRDMMIHDIDLARWLMAEPIVEVGAIGSSVIDPAIGALGDWDTAVATLKGASGALCHITNSRRCVYGHGPRLEIHGSDGTLNAGNWTVTPERVLDPRFQARFAAAYQAELEIFIADLRDGKPFEPSGVDGLEALLIAEAATKSARTGVMAVPETVG